MLRRFTALIALALTIASTAACNRDDGAELVVYSGRNENLIRPLLEKFATDTGTDIRVRYAETAELLPTILEEGRATRADVFISQDAAALGLLAEDGYFQALPGPIRQRVDRRFRDPSGRWVGLTGRSRVLAYNTEALSAADVPDRTFAVAEPQWKGRVGVAPTNASFVSWVSAMRESVGDSAVERFLHDLVANDVKTYDSNVLIVEALERGEIDLGLVNHYYVVNKLRETPGAKVANAYPSGEQQFVNVAGAGILAQSDQVDAARELVEYLLSEDSQEYFRDETGEYPLVEGVSEPEGVQALDDLDPMRVPFADLADDLESTTALIKAAGLT